jgi:hypothetical protein
MTHLILLAVAMRVFVPVPLFLEEPVDAPQIAARLGLSPDALAASGCDDTAAASILGAIKNATELTVALAAADEAWELQAPALAALADRLRDPAGAGQELVDQYEAAAGEFATVESGLESLTVQLRDAALSNCDPQTKEAIQRFREGSAAPALPTRVFALELSAEQSDELAAGFALVAAAEESGEEIDPKIEQLISSTEADPSVVAAQASLDENLEDVQDVFDEPH